jgi:acyl carrier protein
MNHDDILAQLTDILRNVLDKDDITLTRATTANEIDGWDSLAQVRIVLAAEKKFGLRFNTSEMGPLPNVGALVDLIARKLPA